MKLPNILKKVKKVVDKSEKIWYSNMAVAKRQRTTKSSMRLRKKLFNTKQKTLKNNTIKNKFLIVISS